MIDVDRVGRKSAHPTRLPTPLGCSESFSAGQRFSEVYLTAHMTLLDQRTVLIAEIRAAFAGVSREGGRTLHEAEALDNYKLWNESTDQERSIFRMIDVDKSWEEVPDKDIERCYSAFSFLDTIGFRYYLPAYMVWDIKYFDVSLSSTTDNVIYALGSSYVKTERELEIFSTFSPEQCQAICHFLKFMASNGVSDDEFANEALRAYWGRFC